MYLDLRREGKKMHYYRTKDGFEIDFVTQDIRGHCELIQVVWDKEDKGALEREERALNQAQEELGFPGRIIDLKDYLFPILR